MPANTPLIEELERALEKADVGQLRISGFETLSGGKDRTIMGSDNFSVAYVSGRSEAEHQAIADLFVLAINALPQLLFLANLGLLAEKPIDMILHCPRCHLQHIDAPEMFEATIGIDTDGRPDWHNPPHRSHLCHGCGCIWRPADVATNGVRAITTVGKADTVLTPDDQNERDQRLGLLVREGGEEVVENGANALRVFSATGRPTAWEDLTDWQRNYYKNAARAVLRTLEGLVK